VHLAQDANALIYHGHQNNNSSQTASATTLHGQFLHISSTSVTAEYIRLVRKSRELSQQSSLEVNFSKQFNLMRSDDRREVMRLPIGLFRFAFSKSGTSGGLMDEMDRQ
jgi:predicted nucleic acid-binding protein